MRLAAIILSVLAFFALGAGIFFYWVGSAFICFDVCPPVSSAGQQLLRVVTVSLGPGLLLALAAWITGLLYLRAGGRRGAYIATLVTPLVLVAVVALIMLLAGGSLTPVAVAGPPEIAPAYRQLSSDWLNVTRYAVTPLAIWAVVIFIAVLLRPARPQG
jgi:hypothetical protein